MNRINIRCNRLSQPNLSNLISHYQEKRSRMSQPSLYSTSLLSGLEASGMSFSALNNDKFINSKKYQFDLPLRSYRRERLSQPTLVTGDYYPKSRVHQRLSHPSLGFANKEFPASLRSPMFIRDKRFSLIPMVSPTKRNRMSTMDFGAAAACYRAQKEINRFNRDRFSIPELETENDLKQMAGTAKQRYSLDSQLNPKSTKSRLLPTAKSPIWENVKQSTAEVLENALFTSAMPIFSPTPLSTSKFRERLSVPEIRNASLKRLLDPDPGVQRHSITDSISEEPRHYAYIYETNKSKTITKYANVRKISLPKKKYLESNFDESERVITTVIETEVPLILSSPKYMKKTHAYSSDPPKWIMKYLRDDNKGEIIEKSHVNTIPSINIGNLYRFIHNNPVGVSNNQGTPYEKSLNKDDNDSESRSTSV